VTYEWLIWCKSIKIAEYAQNPVLKPDKTLEENRTNYGLIPIGFFRDIRNGMINDTIVCSLWVPVRNMKPPDYQQQDVVCKFPFNANTIFPVLHLTSPMCI